MYLKVKRQLHVLYVNDGVHNLKEQHHNYRNRAMCMHRIRKPYKSFFMVNMASGMDGGHVHPMMTVMNNDVTHIMMAMPQLIHV